MVDPSEAEFFIKGRVAFPIKVVFLRSIKLQVSLENQFDVEISNTFSNELQKTRKSKITVEKNDSENSTVTFFDSAKMSFEISQSYQTTQSI